MTRWTRALAATLQRTKRGIGVLFGRSGSSIVVLLVSAVYFLVFAYANGTISYYPADGVELTVVDDPFARMFEPGTGRFSFEPVAGLDLLGVRYLFSPLDAAIAGGIALLVGINVGFVYVVLRHPTSCGMEAYSGLFASIPALLASGACCVPVVVLALGITAGGWLIVVASWLLPVGVLTLVASLVYLASRVAPTAPSDEPSKDPSKGPSEDLL